MKNILIFGADGMLGSDIVKVLEQDPENTLFKHTRKMLDLFEAPEQMILEFVETANPDVIIYTPAHHNVDECSMTSPLTKKLNVKVPVYLSNYCKANPCVLFYISSDYVFGQDDQFKPYTERSAPNPLNSYGYSKLEGETYVVDVGYVIRVAALYGLNSKKNFVDTMLRLCKDTGEVAVTCDEVTTPTHTLDVAEQIELMIEERPPFGIYNCTAQGETTWFMFAKKIFWEFKEKVKTLPVANNHFKRPAIRPFYSVLENEALQDCDLDIMPHWEDGFKRYCELKKEMDKND